MNIKFIEKGEQIDQASYLSALNFLIVNKKEIGDKEYRECLKELNESYENDQRRTSTTRN